MSKTLAELCEQARLDFRRGAHHDAAKALTEARNNFPQAPGERIDQGPDGTLIITTIGDDGAGGQKILNQRPCTGESKEYRAQDYRDISQDGKTVDEDGVEKGEAKNTYGVVEKVDSVEDVLGDADEMNDAGADLTKAELQAALDEADVEYSHNASKAELLELYRKL